MAGVGRKILNLFVEMEDEPVEKDAPSSSVGKAPAPRAANVPPPLPVASGSAQSAPQGAADEVIAKNIADALEKANLAGFDYFEYAKMLEALKPTIPAEQALYQTAYTSGMVMGANKKMLTDSAGHYLSVLDRESRNFAETVRKRIDDSVKGKEAQIESIDAAIKEKAAAIAALTEEINRMSEQKNSILNEVTENKIKIEKVQNDFTTTMQLFTGKIRSDLEKIERYIAG